MSNSLSCGIIGLPNAGKSTLFNALSKNNALVADYPFATIDPNIGIVNVPDERLSKLAEIYNSKKIVPATVKFVDIAGLVEGANKGEGLGNQFLSHIRTTSLLLHVVRIKDVNNFDQVKKSIDIINTELILSDLQIITNKKIKIEKESKSNPALSASLTEIKQAEELLNQNMMLQKQFKDSQFINELGLITNKKMIYIFNIDESAINNPDLITELNTIVTEDKYLIISAKLEAEINELSDFEAQEMLLSYGLSESGLNRLIKIAYKELGLQSFLTAGEKEVRAWTIKSGSNAAEAAGVIHNDFKKGFIAADIVSYNDLIRSGNYLNAKSAGKVRTEGKDYIMKPDDIALFKFNVTK